jgi:outer membrane protein insertion porin family
MGPNDTNICTDSNSCSVGSTSEGGALGGNLMLYSSVQLTYPVPFMTDNPNLKLISFVDMGNVYNTYYSANVWNSNSLPSRPNFSNLRYTAGVGVEYVIPMLGPVGVSFAFPLNKKPGDNTTIFQFTMGTFF